MRHMLWNAACVQDSGSADWSVQQRWRFQTWCCRHVWPYGRLETLISVCWLTLTTFCVCLVSSLMKLNVRTCDIRKCLANFWPKYSSIQAVFSMVTIVGMLNLQEWTYWHDMAGVDNTEVDISAPILVLDGQCRSVICGTLHKYKYICTCT